MHRSGRRYAWVRSPEEAAQAPAPAWITAMTSDPRTSRSPVPDGAPIPTGQRNATLTSYAGSMRRRGMSEAAIMAALGEENAARCDPPLSDGEVRRIAASIARYPEQSAGQDTETESVGSAIPVPVLYRTGTSGLVPIWEQPYPEPRTYRVAGIIPDGAVTILYGDGGQGKSLIAQSIGLHIVTNRKFADRSVVQGSVLYADAELDRDEFVRRSYALASGMDLDSPPAGLYYTRLLGSLSDPHVLSALAADVRASGATLLIVDSLTIGAFGSDPKAAPDMTIVLKGVEALGVPVLAIDHIAKPGAGANLSDYRPYGSTFKYNIARSVLQLVRAEGGGLVLRQTKHNFGPLTEPINLALAFQSGAVRVTPIDISDERLAGIESHLPATERVMRALSGYPDGAPPETLATDLDTAVKTVKNHLTALHKQGRAHPLGDGHWTIQSRIPTPIGTGTGMEPADEAETEV
jgi:hypothetical protein